MGKRADDAKGEEREETLYCTLDKHASSLCDQETKARAACWRGSKIAPSEGASLKKIAEEVTEASCHVTVVSFHFTRRRSEGQGRAQATTGSRVTSGA